MAIRNSEISPSNEPLSWLFVSKIQRDPAVLFWPSGFLEAWGTKDKKTTLVQDKIANELSYADFRLLF